MNKFRNIQKGVFTSLAGLALLGIAVHKYIESGEFDQASMIGGIGLLMAKDQGSSHTK